MLTAFLMLMLNWLPVSPQVAAHPPGRSVTVSRPGREKTPATPQPITDPVLKSDTASCTLPFTVVGKLILLQAKVENTEGNFVLDTGAPGLVLNKTYFRNLEPLPAADEASLGINGDGGATQRALVKTLRLGAFSYFKAETDLLNLGHLENTRGIKILGLLGMNLFKECELVIDYEKKQVHLHHISRKEKKTYRHPMLSDTAFTELPLVLKDNRVLLQAGLGGRRLDFVIDCGAETNLIDSRLPGAVLDSVQVNGRIFLTGAGYRRVEALTGQLSGLSVSSLKLPGLPFVVTSFEHSCFSDDTCIKGVLGYDFLARYKIVFNFVSCKMYISK